MALGLLMSVREGSSCSASSDVTASSLLYRLPITLEARQHINTGTHET